MIDGECVLVFILFYVVDKLLFLLVKFAEPNNLGLSENNDVRGGRKGRKKRKERKERREEKERKG